MRTFAAKTLPYLEFRLSEILPTPPRTFAQAIVIKKSLIFGFLNPLEAFSVYGQRLIIRPADTRWSVAPLFFGGYNRYASRTYRYM